MKQRGRFTQGSYEIDLICLSWLERTATEDGTLANQKVDL